MSNGKPKYKAFLWTVGHGWTGTPVIFTASVRDEKAIALFSTRNSAWAALFEHAQLGQPMALSEEFIVDNAKAGQPFVVDRRVFKRLGSVMPAHKLTMPSEKNWTRDRYMVLKFDKD